MLGFVMALLLSLLVDLAWLGSGGSSKSPVGILVGEMGLWAGFVIACAMASRQKGTGDLVKDFDLRFGGWKDLGIGLGASLSGRLLVGIITIVIVAVGGQAFSGGNATSVTPSHTASALIISGLILCVGAPVVEELYFRGLVQGAFTARLGVGWGIVLQAGFFGVAHVQPDLGLPNVTVVVSIAAFGLVQGWMRNRFGRLGPGIVTHSLFNLVGFLIIVASGGVSASLP